MTNTVFPTFQTQYILNFSSASRSTEHWDLPNTEIFQSKDIASLLSERKQNNQIFRLAQYNKS
jgi:hypothetical protein